MEDDGLLGKLVQVRYRGEEDRRWRCDRDELARPQRGVGGQ